MKVADIDAREDIIIINIPQTKNKTSRKFVIMEAQWIDMVKKYLMKRPSPDMEKLFIGFRCGKPTRQNMGHNTISGAPAKIANYLKLPNSNQYTGHSFRRTSATILADNGGDILSLKRHGGWKSSTVAEGYVEDSLAEKRRIAKMVQGEAKFNENAFTSTSQSQRVSSNNFIASTSTIFEPSTSIPSTYAASMKNEINDVPHKPAVENVTSNTGISSGINPTYINCIINYCQSCARK